MRARADHSGLQTAVFLTELASDGQPHDSRAIGLFRGATGAAEFLFGEEMNFFLREVTVKAGLAREQREHVRAWAADTMPGLALRFKPYMTLADWR